MISIEIFKGALSNIRQFLATKSPLKRAFLFHLNVEKRLDKKDSTHQNQ